MQARVHVCMNTDSGSFFDIFKHALIKTYPKQVSTPPKVSGFHLNSSHSKTQAFMLSNNGRSNKLKNDKSLKNLLIQSLHPLKDDLMACMSMKGTHSASLLHSNV